MPCPFPVAPGETEDFDRDPAIRGAALQLAA
jgi:hypothetical protein